MRTLSLIFLAFLAFAPADWGQEPAPLRNERSLTGFYPTGVYHFGDIETINR